MCRRHNTWFQLRGALAVVVLSLSVMLPAGRTHAQDNAASVPNEVIARLKKPEELQAVVAQNGLTVLDQFGNRPIYRFGYAGAMSPEDKAQQLLNDGRVQYAEPNMIGQTPEGRQQAVWSIGGDTGKYRAQWAPQTMQLPAAHRISTGKGINVAVLDTGADLAHSQLSKRWLRRGTTLVGYDFVDADADPSEAGSKVHYGYGHGTHVAGLVALAAPGARIMPVRVLDQNGAGNIWVLAEALDWAATNGADVINLSLGTPRETALLEEIILEVSCNNRDDDDDDDDNPCIANEGRGVVVVAAVGNGGDEMREYPAAEDVEGLLAVAASTQQDTLATFSTRGSWVDLMAPGQGILSTVPGNTYGTWSGTSMAAPLAAGVAALIKARCGGFTAVDIAKLVEEYGKDVGGPVQRRADALLSLQETAKRPCTTTLALPAVAR